MIRVELAGAQPLLLMLDLDASATLASARAALSSRMSEQDGFVSDGAVVARDMEATFAVADALSGTTKVLRIRRGALPRQVAITRGGAMESAPVMLWAGEDLAQVRATLECLGRMIPAEAFVQPDGLSFVSQQREASTLLSQVLKADVLHIRSNTWGG